MVDEYVNRRDVLSASTTAFLVGGTAVIPQRGRAQEEDSDFRVEILETNAPVVWGGKSGGNNPRTGPPLKLRARITNESEIGDTQQIRFEAQRVGPDDPFAERTTSVSLDGGDWGGYESTEVSFSVDTEFRHNDSRVTIRVISEDSNDQKRIDMKATKYPEFDVSIDTEALGQVVEGDDISVPVYVENLGHMPDQQEVTLRFDGTEVGTKGVELHWLEDTTKTFTIPTEVGDSGEYELEASAEEATDTAVINVLNTAFFDVDSVENDPVTAGEDVTVSVALTNTGEVAGSRTVTLEVPDIGTQEQGVELGPGETATKEFTFSTGEDQSGSYTGSVDTTDTTFPVELELQEPETEDQNNGNEEGDGGGEGEDNDGGSDDGDTGESGGGNEAAGDDSDEEGPGFGVGSALAALGGTGYLLKRRVTGEE